MEFKDRKDAALRLIPLLDRYKNDQAVVMALPRGGVPIAYEIAKHYHFPLDLLMSKKIGHPSHPEYAVGAVSLEDYAVDESLGIPSSYIEEQVKIIRKSLEERYKLFMAGQEPAELEGKTLILVDDGIATGYTMLASIHMLKKHHPSKIVVAVPVAPPLTAILISKEVDEFICIHQPPGFRGVGQFYADFSQVSDEEVMRLLKDARNLQNHL